MHEYITYALVGAKHLYLLDFSGENLPELKKTIATSYPDVKVTVIQADAADEKAIAGVCKQALDEEGRLDVFFANVRTISVTDDQRKLISIQQAGIATIQPFKDVSVETYNNVMRVNTLS